GAAPSRERAKRVGDGRSNGQFFERLAAVERGLQPARSRATAAPGVAGVVAVLGGDLEFLRRLCRALGGTAPAAGGEVVQRLAAFQCRLQPLRTRAAAGPGVARFVAVARAA